MRPQYIYLIRDASTRKVKIGYSRCLDTRLSIFNGQFDVDTTCCAKKEIPSGTRGIDFEREIHKKLRDKRTIGEWFDLTDEEIKVFVEHNAFSVFKPQDMISSKMGRCQNMYDAVVGISKDPCVACGGNEIECPKTRLKCQIAQSCWKVKA